MKHFPITILVLVAMLAFAGCAETTTDPATEARLSELLENRNFFKLHTELTAAKNKLSEDRRLFYLSIVEHVFNQNRQSNRHIEKLLTRYTHRLNDTLTCTLLKLQADNHIQLYQYREAAEVYRQILSLHEPLLDNTEEADYENMYQLWQTLSPVKPQRIHKPGDVAIAAYRNAFNHLMLPVKCGGVASEFIFDSGANLSTITESLAAAMGLTLYESDIRVNSGTSIVLKTKLGVADSLQVGDILFENVAFLVIPDAQMSFPQLNYYIHGIVGFPLICQMGEIHLHQNGTIFIPQKTQDKSLRNMYIEALQPVVQIHSGADTLLFMMDTGATGTSLSAQYYRNHREAVEHSGTLQRSSRGGAGGMEEASTYQLKDFPYTIGSQTGVLPDISVETTTYSYTEHCDGVLGQDILSQFNKTILNFQYMYVDFE